MLKVENVTKKYGDVTAVDNISFETADGSIAVMMGPNGAGKSTIIKCIVGLLRFEGNISVCGLNNKSLEAKRIIGYIPEMPAVYDLLTVREHMEFIGRAYELSDWKPYSEELLSRFQLADKGDKLGKELSKGMQQKLSICCGMLHRPRVIIFDEPMVGLDPHAIKELKLMFKEMKDDGATVVISTHMLDSVEDYWDEAHIMMQGRFAISKNNNSPNAGDKTLEEMFFEITEGRK